MVSEKIKWITSNRTRLIFARSLFVQGKEIMNMKRFKEYRGHCKFLLQPPLLRSSLGWCLTVHLDYLLICSTKKEKLQIYNLRLNAQMFRRICRPPLIRKVEEVITCSSWNHVVRIKKISRETWIKIILTISLVTFNSTSTHLFFSCPHYLTCIITWTNVANIRVLHELPSLSSLSVRSKGWNQSSKGESF